MAKQSYRIIIIFTMNTIKSNKQFFERANQEFGDNLIISENNFIILENN